MTELIRTSEGSDVWQDLEYGKGYDLIFTFNKPEAITRAYYFRTEGEDFMLYSLSRDRELYYEFKSNIRTPIAWYVENGIKKPRIKAYSMGSSGTECSERGILLRRKLETMMKDDKLPRTKQDSYAW